MRIALGKAMRLGVVVAVVAIAAMQGAYLLWFQQRLEQRPTLQPLELKGQWLTVAARPEEAYASCFRREFRITGNVRNAWLAVAAEDGFEVTVNGRAVTWLYLWRPTRAFQTGLNQRGQWLSFPQTSLSLNFSREYQWAGHENWRLPTYVDLTPRLQSGKNVVCVEVESRRAPAKVIVDGEVEMANGERVSLASGRDWRAEIVAPRDGQRPDWRATVYRSDDWRRAAVVEGPTDQFHRLFDPRIFSTAFQGVWLRDKQATAQDSAWFETTVVCPTPPEEAWMRLAANRNYELFVNGRRVRVQSPDHQGQETGEWIFRKQRGLTRANLPTSMDADDFGELFESQRFESPRQGMRLAPDLRPPLKLPKRNELAAEKLNELKALRRGVGSEVKANPVTLGRNLAVGGFFGYNISKILQQGENKISIRLNRALASDPANWQGQVAVDGEVEFFDGSRLAFGPNSYWRSSVLGSGRWQTAQTFGAVAAGGQLTRPLDYRGSAFFDDPIPAWGRTVFVAGGAAAVAVSLLLAAVWSVSRLGGRRDGGLPRPVKQTAQLLMDGFLPFAAVTGMFLAVRVAFGERSEQLWYLQPEAWRWAFAIALILGAAMAGLKFVQLAGGSRLRPVSVGIKQTIRKLPSTKLWFFIILWVCLCSLFIRMYALDFQPLDDDEWPTTLGLWGILRTGAPAYLPETVWYTRSPLYHYFTAASVWLFGENIWAMRMPTVLFGVATGWLLYLCGSRLLGRPWVGLAALVLATIHPGMMFTSHMVRFYQQQQFFALLTIFFFCKGFVTEQSQKYRYLTVAGWLAAALSQEITAVALVSLGVGYVLFAQHRSWTDNVKLLVVLGCALFVIVIDFMIYETHCLTRLEGYAPSMQADVQPHFWDPYNLVSLFINYSRIHIVLTLALLLGMPAALRERSRVSFALHFMLFSGVALMNVMVTQVSIRYQFWLFPLFILLSIDNARAALSWLASRLRTYPRTRVRLGFASVVCLVVFVIACGAAFSPWRVPETYQRKLLGDSVGALAYIRSQLRPGDKVLITQPHAKAAYIETGQIDYEMQIPIIFDFVVLQGGRLVDRATAVPVITSLEHLKLICASNKRLWVALNRDRFQSRGIRLQWVYPAARVELFIRENMQLVHRTQGWAIFLWDAENGHYRNFRHVTQ